ncbi:hypothetical protein B0H11DRAFT_978171 [Mycena galericulata]|nr:hypothetical protein B0H11DRAFT_978171 [Mycena galericulata]
MSVSPAANPSSFPPSLSFGIRHPPPPYSRLHPTASPVGVDPPCTVFYGNDPQQIKSMVQQATEKAVMLRPEIVCEWNGCGKTVSTVHGALGNHMQDCHSVGEERKVSCLWTGCSSTNLRIKPSSLERHLKSSQHLRFVVHCPSCNQDFARRDVLRRHLQGNPSKAPASGA